MGTLNPDIGQRDKVTKLISQARADDINMNKIRELGDKLKSHLRLSRPDATFDFSASDHNATSAARPARLDIRTEDHKMATTPNSMADVKDWLLNKCRDAGSLLTVDRVPAHGGRQLTYSNVVVTPDNIPEFTIPIAASDGSLSPPDTDGHSHSSTGSLHGNSSTTSPRHSLYQHQQPSLTQRLLPAPAARSRSAPVSPMRSAAADRASDGGLLLYADSGSVDPDYDLGLTNSDPMSLAALSLPHLKMRTQFGFETLSESPHTRRKESLFHIYDGIAAGGAADGGGGSRALPLYGRTSKRKTPGSLETVGPQIITEGVDHERSPVSSSRGNKRRHNVAAVIAPLGIVLSPNARSSSKYCTGTSPPRSCPELTTKTHLQRYSSTGPNHCDHHHHHHHNHHHDSPHHHQRAAPRLRRASLKEDSLQALSSSLQASSEHCLRRNSSSHLLLSPTPDPDFGGMVKARSSSTMSSGASSPCSSCRSLPRGSEALVNRGQLRLSLLYLPKQQQLKVGILRAENLNNSDLTTTTSGWPSPRRSPRPTSECPGEQFNPYVKLCLMPGKLQRQVSRVVRHTRHPVFNQDFMFHHLMRHQVAETRLRLKVYHKVPKLGRDELLGELQLSLADLVPSQETRILRDLDPPSSRQELGYIHMSVCFHASAEKLTVNIDQVTDLSRHTFTGAPDPYIRIELTQPQRDLCSQQTKTKKKNTTPVFNESFTFPISPKIEDLNYTTLTVTVLDRSTLRADGPIGQVRLGYGATEEAEFHHWNQVLQQPGHATSNWHMLMDPANE